MTAAARAPKAPAALEASWKRVWRHALAVMREQGTWADEQGPLLDEYVLALREAAVARGAAEADPYHETEKGLLHPHPGFAIADRAARRAVVLAEQLVLTPKAQRQLADAGEGGNDGSGSDQAGL